MTENVGIDFKLFAPYNEEVALLGEWDNWQKTPMTKAADGWWHVEVPLADGVYQYRFGLKSKSYFMVDKWVEFSDPRAAYITAEPQGECAVINVRDGKRIITSYEWKHDDTPLPPNDQLIIYELHVGDFSGGPGDDTDGKPKGRFQNVIDKLDYLTSLGINAIELMPCNEFPGDRSWGYNPRNIFAVENNYGSPDELCRLVDECHGRGIRVIHDGVYNHSEDNAPLTQIDYTYWYYRDNPDEPGNRFGPKFDYEHFDTNLNVFPARQHVRDAILFWIDNFHIDGVRFDATYLIKHHDFLKWLHDSIFKLIKQKAKPFYTIAENIPQDPTIAGADGPLDAAWHENFYQQLLSTMLEREHNGHQPYQIDAVFGVLDPHREGFGGAFNVVNYTGNHDQDRPMYQLGQAVILDEAAFRRLKLGAALLLTAPGVPMIWMGDEFGESRPKSMDWERISWALLQNERNADLQRYYSGLIYLRKTTPALTGNTFDPIFSDADRAVLAYKRWNDQGSIVVVVANLKSDPAGQIQIPNWPGDGKWHEYTFNYDVEVQGGVLNDTLGASEVKVYLKVG